MRFRCSEDHLCTYHNHSYTGNVFYYIANRVEFTKFASIGDFQVSLITVCSETQNIFSARAFRL